MEKIGVSIVEYPIKNGIITDWEKMEKVWNFVFEELKTNPSEQFFLQKLFQYPKQIEKK